MSPLVLECQKALNDISTRHAVRLYWVSGHAGVRGNEIADGSALKFVRLQPALSVSTHDFFFPMPPHVLMNFRGFPPGCGDNVADF